MQETQYDPAGLELAGLAPPSPGIRGLNNYRFNGKEFQADLGLAWNHQDWRFFDPQLLRWHAGDPELENGQESWTPYSFGYGNAVRYADVDGRCPECPKKPVNKQYSNTSTSDVKVELAPESPSKSIFATLVYLTKEGGPEAPPDIPGSVEQTTTTVSGTVTGTTEFPHVKQTTTETTTIYNVGKNAFKDIKEAKVTINTKVTVTETASVGNMKAPLILSSQTKTTAREEKLSNVNVSKEFMKNVGEQNQSFQETAQGAIKEAIKGSRELYKE